MYVLDLTHLRPRSPIGDRLHFGLIFTPRNEIGVDFCGSLLKDTWCILCNKNLL